MALPLFDFWFGPANTVSGDSSPSRAEPDVTPESVTLALDPTDATLVERVRQGNAEALEILHRTYWLPLVRSAARLVGSVDTATDVVQDVFADIWTRRAAWRPQRSIATYLYRAVRNRALHVARDAATEARWNSATPPRQWMPTRTVPTPSDELSAQELNAIAHATLNTLPPRCREAFLLYAEQRLEIPEIAAVMGIAESTAQLQVKRAMAVLRKALDAYIRGDPAE